MATYEYRIIEHKPAGGRTAQISERINAMAEEGWEPFMMSGADDLTIMMRRAKQQAPPAPVAGERIAVTSDED